MNEQTILILAILGFLVVALLVLPGALFIQLVQLLLSSGLRAVQHEMADLRAQIASLTGTATSISSQAPEDTPTTLESPVSPSIENIEETK
jgi:cell shape-determining protein MreC